MKHELITTNDMIRLREKIYDILIYNLDVYECIWYIFTYFFRNNLFQEKKTNYLFEKIHTFFVQFGNNYRAIFHIENLFFIFLQELHTNDLLSSI
jgi:hypothetical protein